MTLRMVWRALAFMLLLCGAAVLFAWAAQAHSDWINFGGYRSLTDGVRCCGTNDCFAVPANDVQATAAGWLIVSTGEAIPYSDTQASEDDLFWRCKRQDGSRRCFFAPDQGS